MTRKYYAERKGVKREPLDFEELKTVFLAKFEELERSYYFRKATGYECVDQGGIPGTWGNNQEEFFFLKLRMHNLWPIRENIADYDELKLFTVIEFLFDYVSEPQRVWYHSWNQCGYHTDDYDDIKGRRKYREEINGILKDYKSRYELSATGEVLEIPPTGLETISEEIVKTDDPKNIDDRVHGALAKYRRHNATLDDKKDAIRTLADILEYLRKEGCRLPAKDDSDLFRIIITLIYVIIIVSNKENTTKKFGMIGCSTPFYHR